MKSASCQTGTTRYALNLLAHYEVSEALNFFTEAKYVKTESVQEGQPTFSSGALNPTLQHQQPVPHHPGA